MSEETTQIEGEVQTTPVAPESTTPAKGRGEGAEGTSPAVETPSPEELAKKYEGAVKAMGEHQRKSADLERQLESERAERVRQQQIAEAAQGIARQRTDPREAAKAELRDAYESYDPDRIVAAQDKLAAMATDAVVERAVERAIQAQRLASSMPRAGEMLGIRDQDAVSQRLGQVHGSLTPDELALIDLHRQGKAGEYLTAEQERRERSAKQQELLSSLGSVNGARGSIGVSQKGRTHISWNDWAVANPDAKARLREQMAAEEGDFIFTDVPKDIESTFDPMKH